MRWRSDWPPGADFGAVGNSRKGTEHQAENLAIFRKHAKRGEAIHAKDGANFLQQELPGDGSGNREIATEPQLGIALGFFGVVGKQPEIVAGHDFAAEQIGPVFGVFAKILDDKPLLSVQCFVVNDQFCGSATKRLVATEKIAGEGLSFLPTVESITGDEQQYPDSSDHFVDEDLEGKVCEGVRPLSFEERMQSRGGRSADEFRAVVSKQSHPAIEAIAAVDVVVSDGLYGERFASLGKAAVMSSH